MCKICLIVVNRFKELGCITTLKQSLVTVSSISVSPYGSQKAVELSCVSGVWDRVVSCEPVDCGLPDNSHVSFASFTCPWGTTFGKQCNFSCKSSFTLQGNMLSMLMFSFFYCLGIFRYFFFYKSTTYFYVSSKSDVIQQGI